MPAFGPTKRTILISTLRALGFDGPFSGKHHQFMIQGQMRLTILNPHRGDISKSLLAEILRQSGISREDCESV